MSWPQLDSDPVANLAHDHSAINRQLVELSKLMAALQPGQSSATIVALLRQVREVLFLHFAREEEGLFPFVGEAFPELSWQVQAMAAAHDGICGGLSRVLHMLHGDGDVAAARVVFERFAQAYSEHARAEAQLLTAVDSGVSPEQRAQLAALVGGL
jgi:hemerythrin-like domain-containing protein